MISFWTSAQILCDPLDGPDKVEVTCNGDEEDGNQFTFTCSTDSEPAAAYQWMKNGTDIEGETANTLNMTLDYATDDGGYVCRASNIIDAKFSDPQWLYVKCEFFVYMYILTCV